VGSYIHCTVEFMVSSYESDSSLVCCMSVSVSVSTVNRVIQPDMSAPFQPSSPMSMKTFIHLFVTEWSVPLCLLPRLFLCHTCRVSVRMESRIPTERHEFHFRHTCGSNFERSRLASWVFARHCENRASSPVNWSC